MVEAMIREIRLAEGLNPFSPIPVAIVNEISARLEDRLEQAGVLPEASLAP